VSGWVQAAFQFLGMNSLSRFWTGVGDPGQDIGKPSLRIDIVNDARTLRHPSSVLAKT
jgi:hypothetical protein